MVILNLWKVEQDINQKKSNEKEPITINPEDAKDKTKKDIDKIFNDKNTIYEMINIDPDLLTANSKIKLDEEIEKIEEKLDKNDYAKTTEILKREVKSKLLEYLRISDLENINKNQIKGYNEFKNSRYNLLIADKELSEKKITKDKELIIKILDSIIKNYARENAGSYPEYPEMKKLLIKKINQGDIKIDKNVA